MSFVVLLQRFAVCALLLTSLSFVGIMFARPGPIRSYGVTYDCCCNNCLACRRDKECSTGSTGECTMAPYTTCCADACGKPVED